MERRELLKMIAAATGAAMIGLPAFTYAQAPVASAVSAFSEADVALLDEVARVLEGLSRLEQFAAGVRPDWLPEITASRDAILEESRKRMRGDPRALTQLGLPRG